MKKAYIGFVLIAGLLSLGSCREDAPKEPNQPNKIEEPQKPQGSENNGKKPNDNGENNGGNTGNLNGNGSGSDPVNNEPNQPQEDETTFFAKPDNSVELKGAPSERLLTLLKSRIIDGLLPLGETQINKDQLAEIEAFTTALYKDKDITSEREKHDLIFKWIRHQVKYGHRPNEKIPDYNSPYSTFKYCEAICQGYSNLLKVMCYTQGINAPVVNGSAKFTLGDPAGHAWNYVHLDGEWYVSDATNGIFYKADDESKQDLLLPERIDFPLWEDDNLIYSYEKAELTISHVKRATSGSRLTLPYGVGSFRITSFNPLELPKEITTIYIGENIRNLGPNDNRRLLNTGKELERIAIVTSNPYLQEYKGSIYSKEKEDEIVLIPAQLKRIELKGTKTIEKNTIYMHNGVEELYFGEGTEIIEDYAIEACPNLKRVYLPKSIKSFATQALYKCNPQCEIIRL